MKQSMQKKTAIEFKDLRNNFSILKKCKSKVYYLLLEMFFLLMNWDLVLMYNQTHLVQKFLNSPCN